MPDEISVINVFSLGSALAVDKVRASIAEEQHLVAYLALPIHEREMGEHAAQNAALTGLIFTTAWAAKAMQSIICGQSWM
ncbi:MAG: hypothetical protein CM15mP74_09920 [Halieaceae bacterium]|nr:MAG: hypothetical protein CM15mP74_09920 [Halieaceae bacterium]